MIPTKRALFLSSENFRGQSIAAVGVAAHESGHACNIRPLMAFSNPDGDRAHHAICQRPYMGIFFAGFIFHSLFHTLMTIAIVLFSFATLFQLVTLPVEYDASRRAKEQLFRLGLVHEHEREGVSKVLDAAALTYVAGLVSSVFQLLYLLSVSRDRR